jgi:ankyrin repeat protein
MGTDMPVPTATPMVEAKVETPPAKLKSWQTTLKPVSTAWNNNFNYRRALLPSSIYAPAYNMDNRHLPVRVTRQDYERELFQTVATNNLNGTRALLNAGTDINAKNHYGETPLQVARRAGAVDTANLLMARGAR